MKTNRGLVAWVKKSYARGDWYLNGGYFDRIVTLEYIMEKAKQLPKRYTPEYIERSKKAIGKYAGDCICLIKAYIWMDNQGTIIYPKDKATQTATDLGVDTAFANATVKGSIKTIPEIPGVCVRYTGHVGIYIGNGEVIEARGVDYGVVKTKLTNRGWTDWFYYPGIVYEEDFMYLEKGVKGEEVGIWQRFLKSRDYDLGNYGPNKDGIDNSFGGAMVTVQAKWEQDNKRTVDSKVDLFDCLFALDKISNELLTANTLLGKERERVMFLDAEIAERQSRLSKAQDELAIANQLNAETKAILEGKQAELANANKQLFDALALLKSEKDKSALQAEKHRDEISRLNQSHAAVLTEMQRELEETRRKACEPVYDLNEVPTIVLFEEWGKRIWTAIKSIVKK